MGGTGTPARDGPAERLEARMRRVSLVISLVSVGLMCVGLADMIAAGTPLTLPGAAVVPFGRLLGPSGGALGPRVVSLGVILLGLIPVVRVALALLLYVRVRQVASAVITVVVCLELLASLYLGAG